MGKIPSIPADKTISEDWCDSERTISDDFVGNQAQDDALEAESAMVLPAVAEKEESSDSERTLQSEGDRFQQIAGHGYTDGLEVDSAARAKRAVVKSKSLIKVGYIHTPHPGWLKEIDPDEQIWTATRKFRSNGMPNKYYFHKEYDYPFRSRPEVTKFLATGIVPGRGVIKKRSADNTSSDHDHRRNTKRRRIGTAKLNNPSSSSGSTRGGMATTRTKLPHGFL